MDHSQYFPTGEFLYDETGQLHLQTNFQHDMMQDHQNNPGMNQANMFTVYSPLHMDPLMAPVHDLPHLELPMATGGSGAMSEETPIHTPTGHVAPEMSSGMAGDQFASLDRPSSSEEKDLTSAQIRRKAQNRAAQRAFRERKEKHVKELESKLSELQNATTSLATDNQKLKLMLQKAMTENEMLRATSGSRRPAPFFLFPDDDTTNERGQEENQRRGKEQGDVDAMETDDAVILRRKGRQVFTQTAVWDYLIDHPLIRGGHVDISDAWDRVRNIAKNGVDGPVYIETDIKRAIEGSRKGGGDALV